MNRNFNFFNFQFLISVLNYHFLFDGAWRTPMTTRTHHRAQPKLHHCTLNISHLCPLFLSSFPSSMAMGSCKAKFHPRTPWFCISRAKQNYLERTDYGIRNYFGTARGQLRFQHQQVLKVSHFWQEHFANEIQAGVSRVFLQCFNGPNSRTRTSACPWICSLC